MTESIGASKGVPHVLESVTINCGEKSVSIRDSEQFYRSVSSDYHRRHAVPDTSIMCFRHRSLGIWIGTLVPTTARRTIAEEEWRIASCCRKATSRATS